MPKWMMYGLLILLTLLMIPPALIAWRRQHLSKLPRIHLVQDMDNQHRFKAQQPGLFQDGRAMRPPVEGAVPRGGLRDDDHYFRGQSDGRWADSFPHQIEIDTALLQRGQERFNIYCSLCHGHAGYGDGIINERAMVLVTMGVNETTWVPPTDLHGEEILAQPVGQLFNTVTHGVRNMAGYGSQIPVDDRWAIVAYVRALQFSQNPDVSALPAELRPSASADSSNSDRSAMAATAGAEQDDDRASSMEASGS